MLCKRIIYVIFCLLFCGNALLAQENIEYRIGKGYHRMFYNTNNPKMEFIFYNRSNYDGYNGNVTCKVEDLEGNQVYEFYQKFYAAPLDSANLGFSFKVAPGFYKVALESDGRVIERVVMGYEPELMEVKTANTEEIMQKWQRYLDELNRVPVNATVTKIKKTGSRLSNIYKVEMYSAANTVIEGYFAVPKGRGAYPVVITCTDKDEELYIPQGDRYDDRIDFVISPRSSGLRNDDFYYKTCMDVIRAVDFIIQRKECDLKNIILNGRGMGGALAIAAAALDSRISVVSAYAPALLNESVIDRGQMYDVKYLSGRVKCPVIMGVGLEDEICPPHLNFEIYNPIESVKEYYIFINGHYPTPFWVELADNFYRKQRK